MRNDRSSTKHEEISAAERLAALANVCIGLGSAIQGLGRLGSKCAEATTELSKQLLMTAKRATWIERCGDLTWVPVPKREETHEDEGMPY